MIGLSVIQMDNLGYRRRGLDLRKRLVVDVPIIGTVFDQYRNINGVIRSGRVTCIQGDIGDGAVGLSYTLAGKVDYGNGEIRIDSVLQSQTELAKLGMIPWYDNTGWRKRTVFKQLSDALRIGNPFGIVSIEQVLDLFLLPKGVLERPLHQLSNRRWAATIAIGLAQGKRIFSFPWLNPAFIRAHKKAWFGINLKALRKYDVWIIVPTSDSNALTGLADDILVSKGSWPLEELPSDSGDSLI